MKTLKMLIIEDAAFYDAQMNPVKLEMYIRQLSGLHISQVEKAMEHFRLEPGRRLMPMPADLQAQVDKKLDPKDVARITAPRIVQAIKRFGWPNPTQAEEFIGPEGWIVVQQRGGWKKVCETMMEDQEAIFIAQARDTIESNIKIQRQGYDITQPVLSSSKPDAGVTNLISDLANKKSIGGSSGTSNTK